jgi:hypothetical protein
MVKKNMPNSEANARGHLRKSPTGQPHLQSDAMSARQRQQKSAVIKEILQKHYSNKDLPPIPRLDISAVPKSTILHCDYTGALPERCTSGTLYFMVSCCRSYIRFEPLTSLKGSYTATGLADTITFFRTKGVEVITIRMDNQGSPEFSATKAQLDLKIELVTSFQKESNRAERAIQTAKHHIIATRAGFHRDCPHVYLDKCLAQMELTLNVLHPYEYDQNMSAYEGIYGKIFLET